MSLTMSVSQVREIVLSEGVIPEPWEAILRPEVLSSWRRSLLSGAQVGLPELPYVGELDTDSALCAAADPVLEALAGQLTGLGAGVLLADRHARILRRWVSDPNLLPMLDSLRSDAGFSGSEEVVGTNGIGTVAETGRPIQIVGHEHLMESMVPFACVGVPVHHPITRRLEGVITMSCRAESASSLLTPLMRSVAADVEHRLLEQGSVAERLVLDAYLEASRGNGRRVAGVGQQIFIAGPRVTHLLGGLQEVVIWETVREALGGRSEAKTELLLEDGQVVPIVCRPIESQGRMVGALVDFSAPVVSSSTHSKPAKSTANVRSADLPGLVGSSAAWREVVSAMRRAIANGSSALVTGEVGVGKTALAQGALSEAFPDGTIRVIDAATQAWEAAGSAMKEYDAATAGADAVLIRHVEAMSPGVAMALASRLADTVKTSKCVVVGTLTSAVGAPATAEHERLAAVFGPMIRISALRERSEDIPAIAQVILVDAQSRKLRLSSGALRSLVRAPWPGNILQLRALLKSVAADANGEIQAGHLPSEIQACATRRQLTALEHVELKAILDALRQSNGNKVIAANIVGVSRSTLYRKLSSYRIDPDADYF